MAFLNMHFNYSSPTKIFIYLCMSTMHKYDIGLIVTINTFVVLTFVKKFMLTNIEALLRIAMIVYKGV